MRPNPQKISVNSVRSVAKCPFCSRLVRLIRAIRVQNLLGLYFEKALSRNKIVLAD